MTTIRKSGDRHTWESVKLAAHKLVVNSRVDPSLVQVKIASNSAVSSDEGDSKIGILELYSDLIGARVDKRISPETFNNNSFRSYMIDKLFAKPFPVYANWSLPVFVTKGILHHFAEIMNKVEEGTIDWPASKISNEGKKFPWCKEIMENNELIGGKFYAICHLKKEDLVDLNNNIVFDRKINIHEHVIPVARIIDDFWNQDNLHRKPSFKSFCALFTPICWVLASEDAAIGTLYRSKTPSTEYPFRRYELVNEAIANEGLNGGNQIEVWDLSRNEPVDLHEATRNECLLSYTNTPFYESLFNRLRDSLPDSC